jgi:trimeric autotransporter adhesin
MLRNARFLGHLLAALVGSHCATAQVITTIAGTTFTVPSSPAPALSVPLGLLQGIAVDAHGNVYVADLSNNVVIQFFPGGQMTVVAGNGIQGFSGDGGPATSASLNQPAGVAVDAAGNLYIADFNNNRIRKVSLSSGPGAGTITTIAGNGVKTFYGDHGPATSASLSGPTGVALDSAGNLYIADTYNERVREVSVSGGTITTIAGNGGTGFSGDGAATSESLYFPAAVAVDSNGNVYIADAGNNRIREVSSGTMNTVAGDAAVGFSGDGVAATSTSLNGPQGVAVDSAGNFYIADIFNNRIRKVSGGIITTVAGDGVRGFSGDGGAAMSAELNYPYGVAVDSAGNIYLIDYFNLRIREVVSSGTITTVAGNGNQGSGDGGLATSASLNVPYGVALDANGNLYIADSDNNRIRKVSGGTITTVAGNGAAAYFGDGGSATSASLNSPQGVAVDSAGNLYIADTGNNVIRKVSDGSIKTVAGNGVATFFGDGGSATSASLHGPTGVAIDSAGNLYIADEFNNRIREVSNGMISTVAGNGVAGPGPPGTGTYSGDKGPAMSAGLNNPFAVALDSVGNLYIADQGNNRIREVSVSGGMITTVAGGGSALGDGGPATSAELNHPFGVAVDSAANLYIADTDDQRVRKVAGGTINTFAGNGTQGVSGDGGPATSASLFYPEGLAVDPAGNLYIADSSNFRIREVLAIPPTFTASPLTLSFSAVSGGLAPPPQGVQIKGSVANLAFTAQVDAAASWLTLSANSGTLPYNLQVSVDPSQLAPGPYAATIVITAPLASTAPISIQVYFTVTAATTPNLALSAQSLSFSMAQGASQVTSQLTLTNQSGSLNFTAVATALSGGNWISISPTSGTVTASSPVSLTVTANPANLTAGTYAGTITVTSSTTGQAITIPATLTVSAPPQKIILSQLGFTFVAVAQGGAVLPQSLTILNGGAGSMSWTAQLITPSGSSCPWLSLSESSGTVTRPLLDVSQVEASIDAQGLALNPGSYYCLIQVSAADASNSPQSALVVLDLLQAGSTPGPDVEPSGLVFTAVAGAADQGSSKAVMVANVTGAATINFSAVVGYNPPVSPWLILPADATVTPQQPTQIAIQPNFGNLPAGVYHAGLELVFDDGEIRNVTILGVVAPAGATPTLPASRVGEDHASSPATACTPNTLHPTFTQLGAGGSTPVGWPSAILAEVVDDCGNAINSGSVIASFGNGDPDPPLPLISIQNGQWSATWTPSVVPSNGVTVTLNATSSNLSGTAQEPLGLGPGQSQPIVASPVSAVTLTPGPFAPGDLMLIQGAGLADAPSSSSTQVVFNGGQSAQLLYVDPSNLIALVPRGVMANSTPQFVISRDTATILVPVVNISTTHPAILSQDGKGLGQALIYNAAASTNNVAATLADASHPAQVGATIIIYCSGLGAMDAQGNATNIPSVSIGGVAANVTYAGSALPGSYPPGGAPTLLPGGLVSAGLGGLYQITATVPAGLAGGPTQVIISSVGQASQSGVTMMIAGSTSAGTPTITSIDTAGGFPTIAQNGWIEIKGSNLAPAGISSPDCAPGYCWQASDFVNNQMPTALHGVSATVDGKPAYVYFISPTQINVLTPLDSATGSVQVVVNNNGALSTPFTITENAVAPSFLLFSTQGYIAATHLNNSLIGPATLYPGASTPAAPGETIVAYAVGFGLPSTPLTAGSETQSGSLPTSPSCKIGGNPATVGFAGLISPGLYQFNMTIPSTAASGDNPIICTYGGLPTPGGDLITIQ